jgi:hypothetical protein
MVEFVFMFFLLLFVTFQFIFAYFKMEWIALELCEKKNLLTIMGEILSTDFLFWKNLMWDFWHLHKDIH